MSETKRSFSKILAAVDGSEQSFKAAEYAIGIGKKYSVQLIALTVLDISKPRLRLLVTATGYLRTIFIKDNTAKKHL